MTEAGYLCRGSFVIDVASRLAGGGGGDGLEGGIGWLGARGR